MSYTEIVPYLEKLTKPEFEEYFLIISPKDLDIVYMQFTQGINDNLYCEVVSNNYLPDEYKLNSKQIGKLTSLGFIMEPEDVNHNQLFKVNNEFLIEELAKLTIKIFVEIFGITIYDLDFTFDG